MGTKTVSLSEDAYKRLKHLKRENESFSDVITRITGKIKLNRFHGLLKEEAAEDLEETIAKERERHAADYIARTKFLSR